ncbi:hypothetical protein [Kamptonema formosum]|uniref:hypothetical protein n=1 Tax=Kamptonema formosum TaxID=331992 RepID=UPI00034CC3D2|nr:hypothetical protein [Oscillatoria sp. PCC 10802]
MRLTGTQSPSPTGSVATWKAGLAGTGTCPGWGLADGKQYGQDRWWRDKLESRIY